VGFGRLRLAADGIDETGSPFCVQVDLEHQETCHVGVPRFREGALSAVGNDFQDTPLAVTTNAVARKREANRGEFDMGWAP